jgi:hypothetical protein
MWIVGLTITLAFFASYIACLWLALGDEVRGKSSQDILKV